MAQSVAQDTSTTPQGKELIAALETKHPTWKDNESTWKELEDVLYDGVKTRKSDYIQRGDDEDPTDYARRLSIARFKGELSPIINRLVGAAMSRVPSRPEALVSKWGKFIKNCDGAQTDLDEFNEDRLSEAFGFGASVVLIDRPTVDANGMTSEKTSMGFVESSQSRKVDPDEITAVPYRIAQLVNWEVDRYGEFNWIRLLEVEHRSPNPLSAAKKIDIYREFDRQSWRVFEVHSDGKDKTAALVSSGDHNVGIVPVSILFLQKSKPMSFYSPMRYAYQHDIAGFQSDSDLAYNLWKYGSPTIVDYTQEPDDGARIVVGPNARIRRNPAQQEDAKLLEATGSTSEQLRKSKDEAIAGIRRISGIDPLSGSSDPQSMQASGRSRAVSFSISEERHLRRASKALSRYERRIFEIAERWVSKRDNISSREQLNEHETVYPTTFSSSGTEGLIDQWVTTRTGINSETYDKQMQVKIVDSALGDVGSETRNKILDEIESNPIIGGAKDAARQFAAPSMSSDEIDVGLVSQPEIDNPLTDEPDIATTEEDIAGERFA